MAEAKAKNLSTSIVFSREQALITFDNKNVKVAKAPTLTLGPTRPTHVMIRGDFLRKGVEVKSGTPAVLPARQSSGTRLDFANWLVSPENPLTARVAVNWVWAKYFGRGLVSTPEDFGTQGQPSSHPELLDWLASEFRSPNGLGWSLKKLHRLIVTSDTYKQSSATRPELIEKDPLNVLLARQSRLRLESEIVRDEALAVSGLLTRTVGGPSIRPPQPTGISELTYAGSAKWAVSTGPDRYRRGLYIWFQRTSPFPMLMTFDNPDSNVCMVRRERSNTPLQALTLLNDVVFVEAAQALAKRARADCKSGCDTVTKLFQLTLGRNPTKAEELRVLKLHRDFSKLAETNPTEAAKLVGSPKPDNDSIAESAAWVAVARTLMNLDEFVTRE